MGNTLLVLHEVLLREQVPARDGQAVGRAIAFLCDEIDKLKEPNELKTLSAELLSTKEHEAARLENAELRSILRAVAQGRGSMRRIRELMAEWDRQAGSEPEDEGDDA